MERNIDRKTLSFGRGMTNVPSDLLSDDTELTESIGFMFRNGEMKPIQNPELIGLVPYTIMYVHKAADYANLIAYDDKDTIHWYSLDGKSISAEKGAFKVGTVYDIKNVGNTLIVATTQGLHYILYKGSTYKDLGTELPKPTFEPYFSEVTDSGNSYDCELKEIIDVKNMRAYYDSENNFVGYFNNDDEAPEGSHGAEQRYVKAVKTDKYDTFLNAVQGCVSKGINGEKEKNRFMFPFFVRCALKLFDGSYTRISPPIVCYPTITRNCRFFSATSNTRFYYTPYSGILRYVAYIEGIDNWEDIIKELVVFASDDVNTFLDMSSTKQKDWYIYHGGTGQSAVYVDFLGSKKTYEGNLSDDVIMASFKSNSDILEELLTKTQFYKISSLKITNKSNFTDSYDTLLELPIKKGTISNLTTQDQLKVDDYYGWTHIVGKKMFPYNKRINLFNIERYPWKGTSNFLAYNKSDDVIRIYTHIISGSMDAWVKSDPTDKLPNFALTGWLYYPDINATEMIIYNETKQAGMRVHLENHPMLNGSYSFTNLPTGDTETTWYGDVTPPSVDSTAHEVLDSQIFTSVVNNPFVFEASGDNTIGTGKIFGIMANTDAVSQGQFGQYPLMVFTSEGIYGLSVNSEGLYSASYPISRDVCNEDSPLVPTDKLVFFASKKGLMAASGNTVACMSEQMKGGIPRNFVTLGDGDFRSFLKGCLMAYDYRDSNIILFSKDKTYQYIYNMEDKVFSMLNSGINAKTIINNYPDNLIQGIDGNIYSLTNKPDIIADSKDYYGSFTTRPLKLGGSITLKSLRAVKHLADTDKGSVRLTVLGSNDCKHWQRITSVGGKPWKYFTFKYNLVGFKAYDSYSGSIVEIQNRRQDKIR